MTSNPRSRRDRNLSWDGIEPDQDYAASRERATERKARQLCAQVQRTLAFLLEAECGDDCLQGFHVERVAPHPDTGRLLVVLRQWDRDRPFDLGEVLARLGERKGYWRSQVAIAISRKKIPDLAFQVLPAGAAP